MELGLSCWSIHFSRPILRTCSISPGVRAVGQAIQGVEDGLVFGEFGDGEFAFDGFVEGD